MACGWRVLLQIEGMRRCWGMGLSRAMASRGQSMQGIRDFIRSALYQLELEFGFESSVVLA